MLQLLKRMGVLFQKEDRLNFFLLSLGILLNSFMEVLGISLIVPFISLLAHPGMLDTNPYLHNVYHFFSFHSFLQFMIVLDIFIIIIFIIKNAVLLFLAFLQARFILNKQTYICTRLFKAYLLSPYSFHLQRNLGQFQEKVKEVEELMQRGVLSILIILTEGLLVMCLFIVLLKTNPILTIVAMGVLAGGLMVYFYFLKDKLHRWGEINNHHIALLWQQVNQGLGSIKESKLLGKELFFVNSYRYHVQQMAVQQNKSELVIRSPRLFIETTVVVLVMSSMAICLLSGQAPGNVFATVSVFALVTLRLMPSLNRISSSWGGLKFFTPSFNAIYDDLVACEKFETQLRERVSGKPLTFQEEIRMNDVGFYYEKASTPALEHVSLTILKNSVVGIIGPSGAGKTTAIDIILGLLEPSSGKVMVDGVDIHSNIRSWQDMIGYIPQIIYLCDDTIRNNIAFALEPQEISDEKVWQALRLAQLDEFVRSLPLGIETTVGERGVRLSGGQRQRIGIARALYHDPQVLVMDEATAALDNETERMFMGALFDLSKEKTIIIIAHRLTTIQQCDKIFFFKAGHLISEGRYSELSDVCPEFRKMAGSGIFDGAGNDQGADMFKGLKLIIYDFDGVMTNNKALLMDDGREAVFIHRGDGLAVSRIKAKGIPQVIVSTEANPIVAARAKKLGIPVFQDIADKKIVVEKILDDKKIDSKDVIFVGNDLNDEGAMLLVGWPVAPADACPEIKKIAKVILSVKGGDGVVRELWDLLRTGDNKVL